MGGGTLFHFFTYEPMQNLKSIAQTLLAETAHFGYCLDEIVFAVGGYGGSKYFFLHLNSKIFVTYEPMQNFKA